jgi:hypothetical protein
MERNPNYTICYRPDTRGSGAVTRQTIAVKDVRGLARFLNKFKENNPNYIILVAFVSDDSGKFKRVVNFLPAEYKAQKWLTGWKERLLANAKDQGYELSWNHGLKPRQTNSMNYEEAMVTN